MYVDAAMLCFLLFLSSFSFLVITSFNYPEYVGSTVCVSSTCTIENFLFFF